MLVNLKSAFLFGLVALSQAEPIRRFERDTVGSGDLEIRAKGKSVTDFLCPDKKLLTKNDVGNALVKGRDLENQKKKVGGKYPGFFGNEGNGGSIFGASAELREFPIIPNSVYNGKYFNVGHPSLTLFVLTHRPQQGGILISIELCSRLAARRTLWVSWCTAPRTPFSVAIQLPQLHQRPRLLLLKPQLLLLLHQPLLSIPRRRSSKDLTVLDSRLTALTGSKPHTVD